MTRKFASLRTSPSESLSLRGTWGLTGHRMDWCLSTCLHHLVLSTRCTLCSAISFLVPPDRAHRVRFTGCSGLAVLRLAVRVSSTFRFLSLSSQVELLPVPSGL